MNVTVSNLASRRSRSVRRMLGVMLLIGSALAVGAAAIPSATAAAPATARPMFGVGTLSTTPFPVGTVLGVGVAHSCATNTSSELYCWGSNNTAGQLGDGTTSTDKKPVAVLKGEMPDTTVSAVASGEVQTCAVNEGEVYCWGQNASVQLGFIGTQKLVPTKVPPITGGFQNTGVTALTASFGATCAIASQKLWCWGEDDGQSGRLANTYGSDTPKAIPAGSGFTNNAVSAAAMGLYSACAVEAGSAYCWGTNAYGQLGDGVSPSNPPVITPVKVTVSAGAFTNTNVTSIAVGASNACVVEGGAVYCWGSHINNMLANGESNPNSPAFSDEPVAMPSPLDSGVTAIALADRHACAVKSGEVWCWGYDINGSLGIGDGPPSIKAPTKVSTVTGGFTNSGVTALSIGGSTNSCATYSNSGTTELACWGMNGRLGNGEEPSGGKPVTVCTTCSSSGGGGGGGGGGGASFGLMVGQCANGEVGIVLSNVTPTVTQNGTLGPSINVTPPSPEIGFRYFVGYDSSVVTDWSRVEVRVSSFYKVPTAGGQSVTVPFTDGGQYTFMGVQQNAGPVGPVNLTFSSSDSGANCPLTGSSGGSGGGSSGGGSGGGGFVVVPDTSAPTTPPASDEGVGESDLITEQRQEQLTSSAGESKILVGGELVDATVTQASSELRSTSPADRTPLQVAELQGLAASMIQQLSTALGGGSGSVSVRNTATGAVIVGLATDPVTGSSLEIPVENVTFISGGGLVLMATGVDGRSPARIGLDGAVEIPSGGYVSVVAGGMTPGDDGEVVVMSSPRLIGDFEVGESGDVREQAGLPTDLELGSHTLVVTVGDEAASLGFRVVDNSVRPTLPVTGGSNDGLVVWSLTFLVAGALVLALDRRRHLFSR